MSFGRYEMQIAIVCNQNQARSQVLSSFFASLLPNYEFKSFGLIAREGAPLPIVINSIFQDWGLEPSGHFAKNLGLHWDEIQEMQVVVAVTSFISEEVKGLGFRGVIVDLEREALLLGVSVTDPQLMPRRQCAYELAKYLKVAVSAFQRIGVLEKGPRIFALLPESEKEIDKALAMALDHGKVGSAVLFGDLIAPPGPLALGSDTGFSRFTVNESTNSVNFLPSPEGFGIYLPASAVYNPAKAYLSTSWHEFILSVSTESLIIVTPPQKNATGMLAESYLCALYADEIWVLQS
jgi:protein-tyrosine-phosphatase